LPCPSVLILQAHRTAGQANRGPELLPNTSLRRASNERQCETLILTSPMGVILTSVLALWHSLPTYDARYGASRLECLPTEILQHISDHLALDSAGSLTLCSRSLLRVLGDRSWYALRIQANEQEKRRFLLLLQRDIPNLLFCYHCWKLHPLDTWSGMASIDNTWSENTKEGLYALWGYRHEQPCTRADGFAYLQPGSRLRFQYAQMIMKVHANSRMARG